MTKQLQEEYTFSLADVKKIRVNLSSELDSDETLVAPVSASKPNGESELTLGAAAINTESYVEHLPGRRVVAVGTAVIFTVQTSATEAVEYQIEVTVATTDGQTINKGLTIKFE